MHTNAFQTLSDPTRRLIVETLAGGERSVSELVARVAIEQSGVSRHLRILNEAGFVAVRPDGQRRLYSLRPEPFHELEEWIDVYRHLWEKRLDRFGRALKARTQSPKHSQTTTKEQP